MELIGWDITKKTVTVKNMWFAKFSEMTENLSILIRMIQDVRYRILFVTLSVNPDPFITRLIPLIPLIPQQKKRLNSQLSIDSHEEISIEHVITVIT